MPLERAMARFKEAINQGLLKIMAKMGISTLQSYKSAQIFEAVGISDPVIDRCFAGTPSRVEGVGFDVLAEEMTRRHEMAWPSLETTRIPVLQNPGDFH